MQRYHLNLYDADGDAPDEEGADFVDAQHAHRAAIQGIRSLLSAEVLRGEMNLRGRLEIVEPGGGLIEVIAFADVLRIVGPA